VSTRRERLTLCMIVKDEEALLPECLESVRGVVDAIVVVDTGSRDRSAAIAATAGAKVISFEWNDDFSAARNAALEHVEAGFVLLLDADERLGPGAGAGLRQALRKPDFDCGLLCLHDADALDAAPADVIAGRARRSEPILVPRLLRRTPDLAWEGVVHEHVAAWLARGRKAATVNASIVHYGAVPELRTARGKNERNLRLLERRCAQQPADAVARSFLARELVRAGEHARARREAQRAWHCLVGQARKGQSADVVMVATLHAFLALSGDDLDEAAEALAQAREWSDAHPNLDLLSGVLFERLSSTLQDIESLSEVLLTARDAFQRCLDHHGRHFSSEVLPGATSWAAATRLGTMELALGRPEAAQAAFEQALTSKHASSEAQLGRLEALLDQGRAAEVLGALEPWLGAGTPDAWTLAAGAATALGSTADRDLFTQRARDAARTQAWISPRRLLCLEALASTGA
jgi:tetratricopeptide (TPR) repeat protein